MASMDVDLNANHLAHECTMTVRLTGTSHFLLRRLVGTFLIRLGIKVMGFRDNVEVND